MKLYIEKIIDLTDVINNLKKNWNLSFMCEHVDNILSIPHTISKSQDKTWSIIMPKNDNAAFVYDYTKHKKDTRNYAGGAYPHRFSIVVYGTESRQVLTLRIVHEHLHSVGEPADDLNKNIKKFLPIYWRYLYSIIRAMNLSPENQPFWQIKYYRWLSKQK